MTEKSANRVEGTVGALLLQRRRELGLTQEEAAKALRVSKNGFGYWENNTRVPRVGKLRALAEFLGLTPGDLARAVDLTERTRSAS